MSTKELTTIAHRIDADIYVAFGTGLLLGSLIGFTGVLIIGIGSFGYYNRDTISEIIQDASTKLKHSTEGRGVSWYEWSRSLIPFPKDALNTRTRKKSE